MYDLIAAPFVDFEFMRRALVACLALAVGAGPLGVFLVLRRMSLMGDAIGHASLSASWSRASRSVR
jgi:zinc/manganese transport system permease protein